MLVICRHGESESNKAHGFTGPLDPPLTNAGEEEAGRVGDMLLSQGFCFDKAYTSKLRRATRTLEIILAKMGQHPPPPVVENEALDERDYGDLNGRSKEEVAKEYGEEQTNAWRRGYTAVPPNGESLEMTVGRVQKYFEKEIKPKLASGEKVLLVSHGNTLRALIMFLDTMTPDEIVHLQLGYAAMRVYCFDEKGEVTSSEAFAKDGQEGYFS